MNFDRFTIEVHRLPPFQPNEYLYEKFKDKGSDKWEVFAWAVRQSMSKFGNLKLTSQTNSDKMLYKTFLRGKTKTLTYAGKTWDAKGLVDE